MQSTSPQAQSLSARRLFSIFQNHPLNRYIPSLLLVILATGFGLLVKSSFNITILAMVYLLAVILSASIWGLGPSVLASLVAVLVFDVLFVPPYGTLAVHDPQYLLIFGIFFIVSVIVSGLGERVRSQVTVAQKREQQTAALYSLTRSTAYVTDTSEILETAIRQIGEVFDADAIMLLAGPDQQLQLLPNVQMSEVAAQAARWVFEHGQAAGYGTTTFPDSEDYFLPMRTAQGTLGVLGLRQHALGTGISADQLQLLETFAGQIAITLEHLKLGAQAEQARLLEESDRFRNALLSSISHDLRTPLAAIMGSVTSLLDEGAQLPPPARQDLLLTIEEEAARLNRLVANLLNMTRLESGALKPERDWQSIEEVIGAALARIGTNGHTLMVDIEPELPLAPFDFVLIEQVLFNLLDNAFKFSASNSPVEICAHRDGVLLRVSIADRGIGIPPNELTHVFEKFHRVHQNGAPGTGLGLSICKGIVEAHGGTIVAEPRARGGTRVIFTLPAPEFVVDPVSGLRHGEMQP